MSLIYRPNLFETLFRDMERLERGIAPYWLNSGDNLQLGETSQEVVNDDNKFGVALDVSQFKPEELKVNLDGRVLTIEASHERKDQDNYMKRSFVRKWTLPEDVDLQAVRSNLSDKGQLTIEAPKNSANGGRNIPIQFK